MQRIVAALKSLGLKMWNWDFSVSVDLSPVSWTGEGWTAATSGLCVSNIGKNWVNLNWVQLFRASGPGGPKTKPFYALVIWTKLHRVCPGPHQFCQWACLGTLRYLAQGCRINPADSKALLRSALWLSLYVQRSVIPNYKLVCDVCPSLMPESKSIHTFMMLFLAVTQTQSVHNDGKRRGTQTDKNK